MFENNEEGVIDLVEKINIERPVMTSYDIINQFNVINSKLTVEKSKNREIKSEIIKEMDSDNDGFISGIDILNFLLNKLQYKSTKIAYKYIQTKINTEFDSDTLKFFQNTYPHYNTGEREIIQNELEEFLLQHFLIPKTITLEIINEINNIYSPPPVKIKHLILHIEKINETFKDLSMHNEIFIEEEEAILQDAINNFNKDNFDNELTNITKTLIDFDNNEIKNIPNEEIEKKLKENLNSILRINNSIDGNEESKEITYNFHQYKKKIIKQLRLKPNTAYAIFTLLKKRDNDEDLISLNDLKDLLISYIPDNLIEKQAEEIIDEIQRNGISIKIPLEKVPFNPKGYVSIKEVFNLLELYYPDLEKNYIVKLINLLDINQVGYITYKDIQIFLNQNLAKDEFSYENELKHIMCYLINHNLIESKSEDYFFSEKFQNKNKSYFINEHEHSNYFSDICTSYNNMNELYEYCLRKQGRINDYDINLLCLDLNYYLFGLGDIKDLMEKNKNDSLNLPNIDIIKNILDDLKIGNKGQISIIELMSKFNNNLHSNFADLIDENKNGYISFDQLFKKLNEIYNTNFIPNLNYVKQNIVLLYENKNKFLEEIKKKLNNNYLKDISLTKEEFYSIFCNDFLNNDSLFEQFYSKYKNLNGKIDINKYYQFLFNEEISYQEEESVNNINKEENIKNNSQNQEISSNIDNSKLKSSKNESNNSVHDDNEKEKENENEDEDENKKENEDENENESEKDNDKENNNDNFNEDSSIKIYYKEKKVKEIILKYEEENGPMRDLVNMLTQNCELEDNITCKNVYMESLLKKLKFDENDLETIVNAFVYRFEGSIIYEQFDLKKFCKYINKYCNKSKFNLEIDVLEKIKDKIMNSNCVSFRSFINTYCKGKYNFSFIELYEAFTNIGNITLYDIILTFDDNQKFDMTKFFEENDLNELFSIESFDPSLKLSLKKLYEYFSSRENKEHLFNKFDLDKNQMLEKEEFIKALKSCRDLNLSDKHIESIVNVADRNKDNIINPAEFLSFLETLKDNLELDNMNSEVKQSIIASKKPFKSKVIKDTDINSIKENLSVNNKYSIEHPNNKFINYIVILQEDLIKNYQNTNSIEYEFSKYDVKKNGILQYDKLDFVLKIKLLFFDKSISKKFSSLAEKGLKPNEKADFIMNHQFNYLHFIKNLIEYNIIKNK